MPRVREPVCEVCGVALSAAGKRCADCTAVRPSFMALRSWSFFEAPVRPALHRLKYRRDLGLGEALAHQMAEYVNDLRWEADMLVPVPLGRSRLRERGYNQAGLISWPLAFSLGIPHASRALERTRETRSQVGLTRVERHDNVRDAFRSRPGEVADKTILVVDDVATTGATLSSCAAALYAAGARDVLALTVARAHRGLTGGA